MACGMRRVGCGCAAWDGTSERMECSERICQLSPRLSFVKHCRVRQSRRTRREVKRGMREMRSVKRGAWQVWMEG